MNAYLATCIYKSAISWRLRYEFDSKYSKKFEQEIEGFLYPTALESFMPAKLVYHEWQSEVTENGLRMNWVRYPHNMTELKAMFEHQKHENESDEETLIGKVTNFDQYDMINFTNPNYGPIRAHLVIRNIWTSFLYQRIRYMNNGYYKILVTGELVKAEEAERQINDFQYAAIVRMAEIMRGNKNYNIVHCNPSFNDAPEEVIGYVKEALTIPEKVEMQIKSEDYTISNFRCEFAGNLDKALNKFLSEALRAVAQEV